MSTTIELQYGVTFGKCDSSDWIDWEIEVEDEAEKAYLKAKKLHLPLDSFEELNAALSEAYNEIEEEEIQNSLDMGDEYTMECQGTAPMDADELNDLVHEKDDHALEYFGLEDAEDEEIEEWDAYDLDELPTIADFDPDFEPESPYDAGWTLNVEFVEHPEEEEIEEDEARQTIKELIEEANGNYEILIDYVNRCSDLCYDADLKEIALEIAESLGIVINGL